eukprot:Opistho-2@20888
MDARCVCIADMEAHARAHLPKSVYDYYASGANDGQTLRENSNAFQRLRFRPRMLRDVSSLDLSTTILGEKISMPICASPTAMQRMAHPDGESATGRASAHLNTCMILSSIATTSIEELAASAPNGLRWFQLYVYKDRALTERLVHRAEAAGFKALVLTVDTPLLGRREPDVRNEFKLPAHLRLANFDEMDFKSYGVQIANQDSGLAQYIASQFDRTLNWKDVQWLKSITKLPIVIKGILTGDDAMLAVDAGAAAILVSNHGARQLDGVPATIEALPEIVQAVRGRVEVYLDGGVRRGTDVLKALALGARAVFVGRPVLWGLAYNGQAGVEQMFKLLRDEIELAMTLAGCNKVSEIDSSLIVHESHYERLVSKL